MSEYEVHLSANIRSDDGRSNFAIIESLKIELSSFAELDALIARVRNAIQNENDEGSPLSITPKTKHAEPHFDESGGCTCRCKECVRVEMRHIDDPDQPISLRQACCCDGCNGSCPGIGRLASVSIAQLGYRA